MNGNSEQVTIPVRWRKLSAMEITAPGDWEWSSQDKKWSPVIRRHWVNNDQLIIRRWSFAVGELVRFEGNNNGLRKMQFIVTSVLSSSASGEIIAHCAALSYKDILKHFNGRCLRPLFAVESLAGPVVDGWKMPSVIDHWKPEDIINTIDPTNDPNVAPYIASETIDEALQQAELREELQADSWAPLVGDWVIRSGGKVSRVSAVVECIDGRVFYALDDTSTKFDRNCLKPYDPRVGDQVVVLKKGSSLQGKPAKVLQVSSTGIHVESLCKTMGALLNPCDLLVDLPAKTHDSDHSADTDKMVGMPVIKQSLTTPKPKTLYIAGPMRGIAWFNYPMFDRIAKQLRDQGCEVISPADEDREQDGFDPFENPDHAVPENCTFPRTMDFHKTVRRCLDAVLQCEEIVLLPGWERSSGAVAELTLAMWLNKRVRHVRIDKDNQVSFVCFWKGLESLAVDLYDEYLPKADEPGDAFAIDDDESSDDILEEALNITRGSRNASYGPPDQDFRRTAGMWSALFAAKLREGETFEPRDVALAMILLKTSRETHQRKRDNWVDIAGYARCGSLCN